MSKSKEIRFGIMCQSPVFKAWEADCINQTLNIKNVELSLIIYPRTGEEPVKISMLKKLSAPGVSSKMFFHWYENLFFRPKCNANINLKDRFLKVPSICCTTLNKNGSEYIRKEDIQKIRNADLDFIVSFSGFINLKGEILKAAKHGIWTYKHADINKYSASPPCYWEIYNNEDVTGAVLYKLSGEQNENLILKNGYFKTIKHSYVINFNNVHFESARFLKDMCSELINDDLNCNKSLTSIKRTSNVTAYSKPNNAEFIKFLFKLFKNKFKKFFKNLFLIEQWNIGYIQCSTKDLIEKNEEMDTHWILCPSKRGYFADPFAIKYNNKLYILFENYEYRVNKAYISSIRIDTSVTNSDIEISLKKAHHLSYPFVFNYDREIYMIPGEWESNRLTLYKAKNFPTVWQKRAVLIEGIQAVDPTLVKYNDLWWLFCSCKNEGPDLRLFIYYSKDLLGPWSPHKKNPVKTDIRSVRPAGKIIEYEGSLIRPSQDSSQTYGGRIILNKICELTPSQFYETPIKFINPNQKSSFNKGIHTLSTIDNIIILDGKRNRSSIYAFRKAIHKKVISSDSRKKDYKKYNFISIPNYIDKSDYLNAIDKIVELLKVQNGIQSIYQMGNINHPGISDVDIFVVFNENVATDFNPNSYFKGLDKYIFTHSIGGVCKSHLIDISKYSLFHNITHLWGERFKCLEIDLAKTRSSILEIQTALEYLISNYMDLTIQLKYKVVKLRMLLQHIKAIKYDLEFLKISSGEFYNKINQLISWLDNWFEHPIDFIEFCGWIDEFYIELRDFLESQLFEHSLYIPEWSNKRQGHNVKIISDESVGYEFTGFLLPKSISGLGRKAFNLNNRFNLFTFKIPFSAVPQNKVLESRFNSFKEIKKHSRKNFPNFSPLISGLAYRIV